VQKTVILAIARACKSEGRSAKGERADIPIEQGQLPHEIYLEVVSDLHGCAHAAAEVGGDPFTII
jgi:hypothetical protein